MANTILNNSVDRINTDLKYDTTDTVYIPQGSKNSITLKVYVSDNGSPITLQDGDNLRYTLEGTRSDGKPIQEDIKKIYGNDSISGNCITMAGLREYICSVPGEVNCEIAIYDSLNEGKKQIISRFVIIVTETCFDENAVVNSDEYSLLTQMINEITDLTVRAEKACSEVEVIKTEMDTLMPECRKATTDATNATKSANTASDLANKNAGLANTAATNANEKADLANQATINADKATQECIQKTSDCANSTINANNATNNANEKALLAETATKNANDATANSIQATKNANDAAILANENAGLANTATGDAITATNRANIAAKNCEDIVLDGVGISDTQIDGTHAFSNQHTQELLNEKIDTTNITNVLTETDGKKVLGASVGKIIIDHLDTKINIINISTDLNDNDANKVASSTLTYALDQKKIDKTSISNNVNDSDENKVASTKLTDELNKKFGARTMTYYEVKSQAELDTVLNKTSRKDGEMYEFHLNVTVPNLTLEGGQYAVKGFAVSTCNYEWQHAYRYGMKTAEMHMRTKWAGVWEPWTQVIKRSDLVQNTEISDATKPASSVATASLQKQIDDIRINVGREQINIQQSNIITSQHVTFSKPFTEIPKISLQIIDSSNDLSIYVLPTVGNVTLSGFDIRVKRSTTGIVSIDWIAIQ